jgi:hypothetical protein
MRVLVCMVALSVLCGVAAAKEDPDTEIARRHYDRATSLYDAGQYREAIEEFRAANKLRPSAALDNNIARCLDRLEETAAAIEAYERYLAGSTTPAEDDEVRQRIAVLRQRLKRARPQEPRPPPPSAPLKAPPLAPERRFSVALPASFLALTIATFAAGGALYGVSGTQYDDLVASGCGVSVACPEDRYGSTRLMEQAGIGLFVAGGAVAVVDVILWTVWAKQHRRVSLAGAQW